MVPSAAIAARRGEMVVVKGQEGIGRLFLHLGYFRGKHFYYSILYIVLM